MDIGEQKIGFSITLSSEPSRFPFRSGFIKLTHTNVDENPYYQYYECDEGFIFLNSLNGNSLDVFKKIRRSEIAKIEYPIIDGEHTIIFYSREQQLIYIEIYMLGLTSVLYNESPFSLASHGIGSEIPPGTTIFTAKGMKQYIPPPIKPTQRLSISVDESIDLIHKALLNSVPKDIPVLFSGGLDSTLIAAFSALAGSKEVDLVNFCAAENAPDRGSAIESCSELKKAFPDTIFNLNQVLATADSLAAARPAVDRCLPPAATTEMNLNIAATLMGGCASSGKCAVLSGLGADELFMGYMKMKHGDADAQVAEYLGRLWTRNGGRDSRAAQYAGKFVVCPFLSAEFLRAALSVPREHLFRADLPRGQGEKWLLRQLAARLGLNHAAARPKQAMQFGSKVAKAKWRGEEIIPQS